MTHKGVVDIFMLTLSSRHLALGLCTMGNRYHESPSDANGILGRNRTCIKDHPPLYDR